MIWHRRWELILVHTHSSRLLCFSLTLQWSSQMYAYKGTHTHPGIFACTLHRESQMRLLPADSDSVRIAQYLTQFFVSDTHITEGCIQSLANLLSQTLLGPASSASFHDWSTHCLAVNGWERRGGPAVSGTGPQMTRRRFGASDDRYAHLWPR